MKYNKFIIYFLFLLNSNLYISFAQNTDSIQDNVYAWMLDDAIQKQFIKIDTVLDNFQIFKDVDNYSISNSYLCEFGSAYLSNIFFTEKENRYSNFIFDKNYEAYLLTKKNQKYYFTKQPYFNLKYIMGPKQRKENNIDVLYTQNVNKNLNIGIRYKLLSSQGDFPSSQTSLHSYNAFCSYIGNRYSMHSAFIRNKFRYEENGGIIDSIYVEKDFTTPNLNKANSNYYKRNFFISQEYKFGTTSYKLINDTTNQKIFNEWGRVNYVFNLENNYRIYTEENLEDSFYKHKNMDEITTSDSLNLRLIENKAIWTFKEINRKNIKFRTSFGISYENLKYIKFKGYVFTEKPDMYNSTKALSDIYGKFGNVLFAINTNFYFEGYKKNNYLINFRLNKTFVGKKHKFDVYFKTKLEKLNPFLYEQAHYSNSFEWDNSFKEKINSSVRFGFNFPSFNAKIELATGRYSNYIYFGYDSIPNQYQKDLSILSARLHKNFSIGKFKINNKIIYQIADNNDIISLPEFAAEHSAYYENYFFKKAIFAQLGYELRYTTEYRALSYMPSTGQFYQSSTGKLVGNYPVINLFVNMNVKDALIFFKYEYINGLFLFEEYAYSLNNYPVHTGIFRIGVRWQFND